jgi:hypothetical protein
MLFTLGCVALVLGGGLLAWAPLAWVLKGRKPLEELDWLLAPFLGASVVILALHNLVYLDCPVGQAALWVWLAAGGLWLWFLLSRLATPAGGRPGWGGHLRASFRTLPRSVFVAALLAYGLNGLGLFVIGAQDYFARAHGDQENYTCIAQFLTDNYFSTDWASIGQKPYLIDALVLKDEERLGAMLLQGFFATTAGADANALFEPIVLLSPALLVLAVYALARRLGLDYWPASVAGLAAAVLPGLAGLHLNCYMSHSLSVPFVLVVVLALDRLAAAPAPRHLFCAVILLAGTVSLYGELTLILAGLVLVCLLGGVYQRTLSLRPGLLLLPCLFGLTLGVNPLYGRRVLALAIARATCPTDATVAGGFADHSRRLSSVWVADIWAFKPGWTGWCVFGLAALLTLCAVRGLCRLGISCLGSSGTGAAPGLARRRAGLILGVLALAVIPVVILLFDHKHPYQFHKLLLSISPLLVVGAAHAQETGRAGSRLVRLRWAPLVVILASGLIGTTTMALQTVDPVHVSPSSGQGAVRDKDYQSALHLLRSLRGKNLVLACGPGLFQNSWMAYWARKNDVWLVSPVVNNGFVLAHAGARPPAPNLRVLPHGLNVIDLRTVPREALLLKSDRNGRQIRLEGDCHLVWSNSQYQLWRLGPGPYTLRPTSAALRWSYPHGEKIESGRPKG